MDATATLDVEIHDGIGDGGESVKSGLDGVCVESDAMAERLELGAGFDGEGEGGRVGRRVGGGFSAGMVAEKLLPEALGRALRNYPTPSRHYLR